MSVELRHLTQPAEFQRCVDLQKIVWGFADRDVVPARMMTIAVHHGGLAIGAFENGLMIAFVFAIPSLHDGRFAQHSHMLAVLEEYRNRGIGRTLKIAQYQDALARGIGVVTWTFDPLETKNAFLNLNRLGAVSNTYYVNLYGEQTSSELHSGLGTDRFLAEWFIGEKRTERIIEGMNPVSPHWQQFPKVLAWSGGERFSPAAPDLEQSGRALLVEAPPDTQLLKKLDRDAAQEWRLGTRAAFTHYFEQGYWLKGLARAENPLPVPDYSLKRSFYLLEHHEN
ncbi:MAG TPA: GNAT family N-acetyltransferase [Acidobacteriota bacterium]|jgi:predicted GNAT superfamily acetyltransferase